MSQPVTSSSPSALPWKQVGQPFSLTYTANQRELNQLYAAHLLPMSKHQWVQRTHGLFECSLCKGECQMRRADLAPLSKDIELTDEVHTYMDSHFAPCLGMPLDMDTPGAAARALAAHAAAASSSAHTAPTCSFNWQQLTPWDKCTGHGQELARPVRMHCGKYVCGHHKLSHAMMECPGCKAVNYSPLISAVLATEHVDAKHCFVCKTTVSVAENTSLRCVCKAEKSVVYCSKDCQKQDWKRHKIICPTKRKQ